MTVQTDPSDTTAIARSPHAGDALLQANFTALGQVTAALDSLSDDQYTYKSEAQPSSLGMHTRHIIEFYQEFLTALQNPEDVHLCYDNRKRDMQLEDSKSAALQAFTAIQTALKGVDLSDQDITISAITNPDAPMARFRSTIGRELYHLIDHTIHHMAIIKMVAQEQNILFDESFGVANATQSNDKLKKNN